MLNRDLYELANQYIPGGVNSPVRSFNGVGGVPFFVTRAKDCYLYDVEGKKYIDYICSWGANILGHANAKINQHIAKALDLGLSYGTPTFAEVEFAKKITQLVPSVEKLRLVNSGTEATMSAIRLARGYTNKNYIIKFVGCYHGHSDGLLVSAGSGLATFNNPSSAGVLSQHVHHTLVLRYNNIDDLAHAFKIHGDDIAGIIIEPFAGNMNLIKPTELFLSTIQKLCNQYNALLIFDEVMTGFRAGLSGAQGLLGIKPDLTAFGKVIGGGMPIAAFGGRSEIMDYLAPKGPVYQAGTLSGNPIAVASGLAVLDIIQEPGFYDRLAELTKYLTDGLVALAKDHQIAFCADYVGGMFGFYFSEDIPLDYDQVMKADLNLFRKFFHGMLASGVYFAPSMFEAGFISISHDKHVIDETLGIANQVLAKLRLS